ncbi:hypothetical protein PspLS_01140, partial [Pyricularia sp. CBS 133598]
MQTALRRRAAIDRDEDWGGREGRRDRLASLSTQELGPNAHWRGYSGGRHKAPARMQCTTYRARYKASGV